LKADKVSLQINHDANKVFTPDHDSGEYRLPVSALSSGSQSLSVSRQNSVMLAGAAGLSFFTSAYEVRQTLTITE
jgi:hypothetical protein